jgi:hypothetical protein
VLEPKVAVVNVKVRLELALDVMGEEAESILLTDNVLELVLLLPDDEVVVTLLGIYVLEIVLVLVLLLNEVKVTMLLGAEEGPKLLVE